MTNISFLIHIISKSFGDNNLLQDVSLELGMGAIKVLMGANGSGKTTLFNILTGFLNADRGKVLLGNTPINHLSPYKINRLGICRTFQNMRLISEYTVLENILLAFSNTENEKWWSTFVSNRAARKKQLQNEESANEILSQCFIHDVADSKAGEIPYGQQKLLILACCLANDPKVILLDEPVAGVNPVYRANLGTVIRAMQKRGKAIIIIEHNSDFIEEVADEILFLNNGKITRFLTYSEFRSDGSVKEAYT